MLLDLLFHHHLAVRPRPGSSGFARNNPRGRQARHATPARRLRARRVREREDIVAVLGR